MVSFRECKTIGQRRVLCAYRIPAPAALFRKLSGWHLKGRCAKAVLRWNGAGRERDIFARKTQAEHIAQRRCFPGRQTGLSPRLCSEIAYKNLSRKGCRQLQGRYMRVFAIRAN
jgi:hypothetical protein